MFLKISQVILDKSAQLFWKMNRVHKKAIIVVSLIEECADCSDEEIKREIYSELSKEPYRIPWGKKVEKVTVESARAKLKREPKL